ncbi:MAG: hypothetical protein KAI70_03595, partial [Candidatus Omnitrophica bacterium]|nr:hypothetical protein [Candidatus Omnitrophota bacterium]
KSLERVRRHRGANNNRDEEAYELALMFAKNNRGKAGFSPIVMSEYQTRQSYHDCLVTKLFHRKSLERVRRIELP